MGTCLPKRSICVYFLFLAKSALAQALSPSASGNAVNLTHAVYYLNMINNITNMFGRFLYPDGLLIDTIRNTVTLDHSRYRPDVEISFCQVGTGRHSALLFEILLFTFPTARFFLFDVHDKRVFEDLPDKARIFVEDYYHPVGCDAVIFGMDSPKFSFKRIENLYTRSDIILLIYNRYGCPGTNIPIPEPADKWQCNMLSELWLMTVCGMQKRNDGWENEPCETVGCTCLLPVVALLDPFHEPVNCTSFVEPLPAGEDFEVQERNTKSWYGKALYLGSGQWHQDWFVYHNFFKHYTKPGVYVDVGAMDSFVLSNTVVFDSCFGWTGLCVEPNPALAWRLWAYRTCQVADNCVGKAQRRNFTIDDDISLARGFASDGDTANPAIFEFPATCVELDTLLEDANIHRVDYLNVDVEGDEIAVLQNFSMQKFDIRVVSIEVSHSTTQPVDIFFITHGFVKVALLGKDHIYVSQSHLREMLAVGSTNNKLSAEMFPLAPLRYVPKMRHAQFNEPIMEYQRRFIDDAFG